MNWRFLSRFFLIFITLILNFLFFEKNEPSILATAKHFVDPSWIATDWWLSTGIEYGNLFNAFAGTVFRFFSYFQTYFILRIMSYALWSVVLVKIFDHFKITTALIPLLIYYSWGTQSMGFGEWMFIGVEAKSFAYLCAFVALLFLAKDKKLLGALFLGLSVSFHILVGFYLTLAFCMVMLAFRRNFKWSYKEFSFSAGLYLLGAIFGVIAVIKWQLAGTGLSPELVKEAGAIYAAKRVSYHTLYHFEWKQIFYIGMATLFSGVLIWRGRATLFSKLLMGMSLWTLSYFVIGVLFTQLELFHLLKFYFFRTSDVLFPFLMMLSLFSLLSWLAEWKSKIVIPLFIIMSLLAFYKSTLRVMRGYKNHQMKVAIANAPAFEWIKNNTKPGDGFVVSPVDQRFYIHAERPIFASFKHSAQKEVHILEWYRRMKLINGGAEPKKRGFAMSREIHRNFSKLKPQYIKTSFPGMSYLFVKKWTEYDLPVVFEGKWYRIYSLLND